MARKKHEEEHENHERWLVSYADFITLLFAFFTVLYATSQKDVDKAEEFQKSVQKSFRSFLDFGGLYGKYVSHHTQTQIIPPAIDVVPAEGASANDVADYMGKELQNEFGVEADYTEYFEMFITTEGVRIQLATSIFFDPASALIREEALPALDKLGKTLKKMKNRVMVEGHSDNTNIETDKFPSNWELSAHRASTIVRYFLYKFKLDPKRFAAVGYADQRPRFKNTHPIKRSKNRRIEVLVLTAKQPKVF